MRTCVRMVVCVYLPRFELTVAAGGRAEIAQQALSGRALAVGALVGAEQRIGGVSGAAGGWGGTRGMLRGEARARCPELVLVPPDPVRVAEVWEGVLRALESIGAGVEPAAAGLVYFEEDGLEGIH